MPEPDSGLYGPLFLVEDFDFDGREDFAIREGHSGPYGSPTYSIFLFSVAAGVFLRSSALSDVAEQSLGQLTLDASNHTLRIASKSGCCVHWFEWYAIEDGQPRLVKRETNDDSGAGGRPCTVTTELFPAIGNAVQATRGCMPSEQD